MQTESISLVRLQSFPKDWSERRDRRSGYARRVEDETLSIKEGAGPTPGPSLGFLIQVAAQMMPAPSAPTGRYQAPRWRCGVVADERA
ncbi:MAG: hypothetical protein WDN76_11035 [Alphaproteobacteria bacterium]